MSDKPPAPRTSDEPTQQPAPTPDFLSRPEFDPLIAAKKKYHSLLRLIPLLALVLVAGVGLWGYRHHIDQQAKTATVNSTSQAKVADPYAGWKTYTSATEQATFRYPSNWKVTKPYIVSNDSNNTDQVGIKSPSGVISISWVADLGNFNNCRCDYGPGTPQQTILDKTPVTGAPGYQVVSGITTTDNGTTYHPWIAIQDSEGQLISSRVQNTIAFRGRHHLDPATKEGTFILFSTSGTTTDKNTPTLTKDQATAWFATAEAQQAKQIFLSFNDPPAPAQHLNIPEWGIQAQVNTNFTLTYKVSAQNDNLISLTSDQLTSASSGQCGDNGGGAIGRLKPTDLVYAPEIADYTAEQFATEPQYQDSRALITKVGDYYYYYYGPQGPCSGRVGDLQEYTRDTVISMLQSFQAVQPQAAGNQYVVKIPELSIQITVPAEMKDLTYHVEMLPATGGGKAPTAYFSTASLTMADRQCGPSFGPLGALSRVDGQYPANDPTAAIDYGHLLKQFSAFYITEGFPNAACSTDATAEEMASAFKVKFEPAASTVQQLN